MGSFHCYNCNDSTVMIVVFVKLTPQLVFKEESFNFDFQTTNKVAYRYIGCDQLWPTLTSCGQLDYQVFFLFKFAFLLIKYIFTSLLLFLLLIISSKLKDFQPKINIQCVQEINVRSDTLRYYGASPKFPRSYSSQNFSCLGLDYNLLTTTPPWGQEIHMFNHFDTLNVGDKHVQ